MSEQRQAASYRLVPMTMEWIPQIAELERQCFSKPWNEQMLAEELDNPTASFIVAVGDNGQVLGYAGISVIAGEGYIDNVAVREHGFEQVGRRKDYYDAPKEDAIIMTKYFQAEKPDENDE